MSAVFHPGHPMHVPPTHHLHHHNHHHNTSNNANSIAGGGGVPGVETNGGPPPPGFMLDDGSSVVGDVGYPHDGMTPPGMVWDPSLQGDGGGKFRLKRRRRCGQCAPCQVKENCNKCQYCMRKDVLKQACIYRKCVYLRKPVPRFRQDAQTPNNEPTSPTISVPGGGSINKPSTSPPRKPNSNNNTTTANNNNINGGIASVTPALSNCSTNSNGSSHNNSSTGSGTTGNTNGNNSTTNHVGAGGGSGGPSTSNSSSSSTTNNHSTSNNGVSSAISGLHHPATPALGGTELSSCRLNQSPFGANPPNANGVILDPLRHRTMMDAHYQHHRAPGAPPFFDPMTATGSTHHHHHQHDLTPAAAAAAAVAAAAAAGNSMSSHHPVSQLNAHSQATKMVSPSSTGAATSREAAAAATTYFPHPAESWGSAVPYAAFPRAPSWAASAYGFNQHSSPFASSFTPSSFPPSPFPGSSCRLSLPDTSSSSSASRYGPAAATTPQHPFHHSMTGISGFSTGDALSHAQYTHHSTHPHAHSNMRSSFYPPAPPTGHHLGSSSTLPSFPGLGPHSFGPSPYHPHPHSHMYPGSFYSSLRAATEPQIYHVQVLPSQNPFKHLLNQTCDFLDSLNSDKSELKPFQKDLKSSFSDIWDISQTKSVPQIICNVLIDEDASSNSNKQHRLLSLDDEQNSQSYSSPTQPLQASNCGTVTVVKDLCCSHRSLEMTMTNNKSERTGFETGCPSSPNIPNRTSAGKRKSYCRLSPSCPQSELYQDCQNKDSLTETQNEPSKRNDHMKLLYYNVKDCGGVEDHEDSFTRRSETSTSEEHVNLETAVTGQSRS